MFLVLHSAQDIGRPLTSVTLSISVPKGLEHCMIVARNISSTILLSNTRDFKMSCFEAMFVPLYLTYWKMNLDQLFKDSIKDTKSSSLALIVFTMPEEIYS